TISTTRNVIVSKSPVVEFTAASPLNSCKLPLVVQFNNTTLGTNEYKWNFGDATVSSAENPTKTYNREGEFDVRLNAINEYGCAGTKLATDLIKIELPKLNFDISNPEGCAPLSTTFKIN